MELIAYIAGIIAVELLAAIGLGKMLKGKSDDWDVFEA